MNSNAALSPTHPMPTAPSKGVPRPMLSTDAVLATPGMAHTGDDALSVLPMSEHLLDRLRAAGL